MNYMIRSIAYWLERPRTETLAASEAASAGCWTESMQAEVDKQIVKKNVKKAIACEDDLLIPEETDADLHEAVKILQAQRDKTDRASANAERRLAHNNQVRQAVSMSGWTVNVEKDCLDQTALLNRNIASKRMRRLGEISVEVQLFIRPDPAQPGQRVGWVAALTGALIATPEFVMSDGKSGACIAHEPAAIAQRRFVWVSQAFVAAHPRISALVQAAASLPASKWQMLETQAKFLAHEAKGLNKIALVTVGQKENALFKNQKNVHTVQSFMEWRMKVSISDRKSAVGNCGL